MDARAPVRLVARTREDLVAILRARAEKAFVLEVVTDRGSAVLNVPAMTGGEVIEMARRPVVKGQLQDAPAGATPAQPTPGAPPQSSFFADPGIPPQTPAQATLPVASVGASTTIIAPGEKWQWIKKGIGAGFLPNDPQAPIDVQWATLLQKAPAGWWQDPATAAVPPVNGAAPPAPGYHAGMDARGVTGPGAVIPPQVPPSTGALDFTSGATGGPGSLDFTGTSPQPLPGPQTPPTGATPPPAPASPPAGAQTPSQAMDFTAAVTPIFTPPASAGRPALAEPELFRLPPSPRDTVAEVAAVTTPGPIAYVERLIRIDFAATADRVRASLRLGEGRVEKAIVGRALDDANQLSEDALLLHLLAKEEMTRVESQVNAVRGSMREKANAELAADKEAGKIKKTISNEDVQAKMAEMFADEYEANEALLRKAKSLVLFTDDLHSRAKSKNVDLRVIFEKFNAG